MTQMTVYNISLLSLSYIHPYSSTPVLRPNIELIDFLYILILNIYFFDEIRHDVSDFE